MVGVHSCLRRGLPFMWKNRAFFHILILWIIWLQIHLDIAVVSTTPFPIYTLFRIWLFLPPCCWWDCWGYCWRFLLFLPLLFLFKLFLQPCTLRLFWCNPGGKLHFCRESKRGAVSKGWNKINYETIEGRTTSLIMGAWGCWWSEWGQENTRILELRMWSSCRPCVLQGVRKEEEPFLWSHVL